MPMCLALSLVALFITYSLQDSTVTQRLSICTNEDSQTTLLCSCLFECENDVLCTENNTNCNCSHAVFEANSSYSCQNQFFKLKYIEDWKCFGKFHNDETACNGHGDCVDTDVCECSGFFTGEECSSDYISYLLLENLKTSLWFVVLIALVVVVASWVIFVHILVNMAKGRLNRAVNMIMDYEKKVKSLQTAFFFLDDLILNLKTKRSKTLTSTFGEMRTLLAKPVKGKYVMKRCYKCMLKIYTIILVDLHGKLCGGRSGSGGSDGMWKANIQMTIGENNTGKIVRLDFVSKCVSLFDSRVLETMGVHEKMLVFQIARKMYATKVKLNQLSLDFFKSYSWILGKYAKVIPRGVLDLNVVTERFDTQVKLKSYEVKVATLKKELAKARELKVEMKVKLRTLLRHSEKSARVYTQVVHDNVEKLMNMGVFEFPDLEKALKAEDVVIDMEESKSMSKKESNTYWGNLDGLFNRLKVRARSKFTTLERQRVEQRQIEIESAVRNIHNSIKANQDSEALYWMAQLKPKIEANILTVDTPFRVMTMIVEVLETLLLSNENNFALLDNLLSLIHLVCQAALYRQKTVDVAVNYDEKINLIKHIKALKIRFRSRWTIMYYSVLIKECLLLIRDDSKFLNDFLSSISLSEPLKLLSLLQKKIYEAHQPMSTINRSPFYYKLLIMSLECRIDHLNVVRVLDIKYWGNKYLLNYRNEMLREFCFYVLKYRGVSNFIPSSFEMGMPIKILPSQVSLSELLSECKVVQVRENVKRRQVVPEEVVQIDEKGDKEGVGVDGDINFNGEEEGREKKKFCGYYKCQLTNFLFAWNKLQESLSGNNGGDVVLLHAIQLSNMVVLESKADVKWDFLKGIHASNPPMIKRIKEMEVLSDQFFLYQKYLNNVLLNQAFMQMRLDLSGQQYTTFNGDVANDCGTFLQNVLKRKLILLTALGGGGKTCLQIHLVNRLFIEGEVYGFFIRGNIISSYFRVWKNATQEKKADILITSIIASFQEKIFDAFASTTERVELEIQLREIITRKKPLFLCFDAFDEIPILERNAFLNIFRDLEQSKVLNVQTMLISSRPEVLAQHTWTNFFRLQIDPMPRLALENLLISILRNNNKEEEEIKELIKRFRTILKQERESPLVAALLLKRLLTTERSDDQEIKSNLHALYESLIKGSILFSRKKYSKAHMKSKERAAAANSKSNNTPDSISQCSVSWLSNVPNPIEFIVSSLVRFTSVLTENKNYLMFSHMTIQEFFCSRFLCNPDGDMHLLSIQNEFQKTPALCFRFFPDSAKVSLYNEDLEWHFDSGFSNVCRFFLNYMTDGLVENLETANTDTLEKSPPSMWTKMLHLCDKLPKEFRRSNLCYVFRKFAPLLANVGLSTNSGFSAMLDHQFQVFVRGGGGGQRAERVFFLPSKDGKTVHYYYSTLKKLSPAWSRKEKTRRQVRTVGFRRGRIIGLEFVCSVTPGAYGLSEERVAQGAVVEIDETNPLNSTKLFDIKMDDLENVEREKFIIEHPDDSNEDYLVLGSEVYGFSKRELVLTMNDIGDRKSYKRARLQPLVLFPVFSPVAIHWGHELKVFSLKSARELATIKAKTMQMETGFMLTKLLCLGYGAEKDGWTPLCLVHVSIPDEPFNEVWCTVLLIKIDIDSEEEKVTLKDPNGSLTKVQLPKYLYTDEEFNVVKNVQCGMFIHASNTVIISLGRMKHRTSIICGYKITDQGLVMNFHVELVKMPVIAFRKAHKSDQVALVAPNRVVLMEVPGCDFVQVFHTPERLLIWKRGNMSEFSFTPEGEMSAIIWKDRPKMLKIDNVKHEDLEEIAERWDKSFFPIDAQTSSFVPHSIKLIDLSVNSNVSTHFLLCVYSKDWEAVLIGCEYVVVEKEKGKVDAENFEFYCYIVEFSNGWEYRIKKKFKIWIPDTNRNQFLFLKKMIGEGEKWARLAPGSSMFDIRSNPSVIAELRRVTKYCKVGNRSVLYIFGVGEFRVYSFSESEPEVKETKHEEKTDFNGESVGCMIIGTGSSTKCLYFKQTRGMFFRPPYHLRILTLDVMNEDDPGTVVNHNMLSIGERFEGEEESSESKEEGGGDRMSYLQARDIILDEDLGPLGFVLTRNMLFRIELLEEDSSLKVDQITSVKPYTEDPMRKVYSLAKLNFGPWIVISTKLATYVMFFRYNNEEDENSTNSSDVFRLCGHGQAVHYHFIGKFFLSAVNEILSDASIINVMLSGLNYEASIPIDTGEVRVLADKNLGNKDKDKGKIVFLASCHDTVNCVRIVTFDVNLLLSNQHVGEGSRYIKKVGDYDLFMKDLLEDVSSSEEKIAIERMEKTMASLLKELPKQVADAIDQDRD